MIEKIKNSKIIFVIILIFIIVMIGSMIIYLNKNLSTNIEANQDEILNMPDEVEELGTPIPVE